MTTAVRLRVQTETMRRRRYLDPHRHYRAATIRLDGGGDCDSRIGGFGIGRGWSSDMSRCLTCARRSALRTFTCMREEPLVLEQFLTQYYLDTSS
jgi:hypothetical protein